LSTPSTPSSPNAAPQSQAKPKSGPDDVREAIAVLSVRCTPPQHLAPMAGRLIDEWTRDLQWFAPAVLVDAVRAYGDTDRGRKGYWPSLGEIKALCGTIEANKLGAALVQAIAQPDWADEWPDTWAKVKHRLGNALWTAWLARCRWDEATRTLICPDALTADQAEWRHGGPIRAFVGDIKFVVRQ
jgi:hypothetical protein